ncbi:MAG: HD domain-containing protein [Clostridia bacterium]|nr:HD domain-containing protein [Clostridia bacterium]MDD4386733.1 HD domain-containing protein [Clostridia bacterium]
MALYELILNNSEYLKIVEKTEKIKFITDGKWDWEHGLGHYKRVAQYVKNILTQLKVDERTIDLGMASALLHDIGLSKGDKIDHAIESSKLFVKFIKNTNVTKDEKEILRQAIRDHSKGNDIKNLIGLALVLADKLDVTYHRTENSSIQDEMNIEIQKIKNVYIEIKDNDFIVSYTTDSNFDVNILKAWEKAITIPQKIAKQLNKKHTFIINGIEINCDKTSDFFKNNI